MHVVVIENVWKLLELDVPKIEFWIFWTFYGLFHWCINRDWLIRSKVMPTKWDPVSAEKLIRFFAKTGSGLWPKVLKIEHCRHIECSSDLWTNICGLGQIKQLSFLFKNPFYLKLAIVQCCPGAKFFPFFRSDSLSNETTTMSKL